MSSTQFYSDGGISLISRISDCGAILNMSAPSMTAYKTIAVTLKSYPALPYISIAAHCRTTPLCKTNISETAVAWAGGKFFIPVLPIFTPSEMLCDSLQFPRYVPVCIIVAQKDLLGLDQAPGPN
jgi:hypothetical protein